MSLQLPFYCVVGARPVRALATEDGGMTIEAFNWDTGGFDTDMSYLTQIMMGGAEVDVMDASAFEAYTKKLREERGLSG